MTQLIEITRELRGAFDGMTFDAPVTHVYNPLEYAWPSVEAYLKRFGASSPREVVMLGMNPGPWGMAQTGVPFGDVGFVRDWMGIEAEVGKPSEEHPKRPIDGFACERSEVSGSRLWGWAKERFGEADNFFDRFFVWNYCPLSFMEESGRNRTPDKLPVAEREQLFAPCDAALRAIVDALQPKFVIGVGAFAETQAKKTLKGQYHGKIGRILHPSPASPKANRGWAEYAEQDFEKLGVALP